MTLSAGTRLGPYEVLAPLGAGGMGEVYKAKDTRLDRMVAVKVLPSHLAETPDAKARFEREARAISQLSHPHICALYDVGSHEGTEYLVMELLEGQTLADRLERGPLPIEQVLRFGGEIADALDRAHRAGIVHRDLKPGNVMLTKSGVKLLDFGLAKAAGAATADVGELSSLPTEAERPLTERGTILGTFQYMAPEQLEGVEADARSDIFAFGCVLYEMATGKKAFTGASRVSLISSILRDDPRPISAIAPMTPPALDRVVKNCLAKDPEDRWQSAHDVRSELAWIAEAGSQAGAPAVVVSKRKNRERLAWIVAAGAVLVAVAGWLLRPSAPRRQTVRLGIPMPVGSLKFIESLTPSPDGSRIAFIGHSGAEERVSLFVRPIGSLEARALPGTDGASLPFWSPDGRKIAFFADRKLRKIDAAGGPAENICDAPTPFGGSWSPSGTIVLAPRDYAGLYTVSSDGGTPTKLTSLAAGEEAHRWPVFLPDGKHVVFLVDAFLTEGHWLAVTSLDAPRTTRVANAVSNFAVAPPDRILYVKSGGLVARRFDVRRLRFDGDPEAVGENVLLAGPNHRFDFGASGSGLLVYQSIDPNLAFTWYDRSGKKLSTIGEPGRYLRFEIAPDGSRVAFERVDLDGRNENLWSIDLARGVMGRLTTGSISDFAPTWTPDGRDFLFSSTREGMDHFYEVSGGTEPREVKTLPSGNSMPWSCSPDGRHVLYETAGPNGNPDLWVLSPGQNPDVAPFRTTEFSESEAQFSPDGKWVAFSSDDTGRREVYVRPFAGASTETQVSAGGGSRPRWRADGREIYFWKGTTLMAAAVATAPTFRSEVPTPLFSLPVWIDYAVAADGRFLILAKSWDAWPPTAVAVMDWTEGARK